MADFSHNCERTLLRQHSPACLSWRHGQPLPDHPHSPIGLQKQGRCSPFRDAAVGRRNKRPPSLFGSPGHGMLCCHRGVPAWRGAATKLWRAGRYCRNPSRELLGASPCSPGTVPLQKASQLCSKASQFPAVCLFVPPSKGFSSWKLLLH